MQGRQVLLTFDLEEFDIANEFGSSLGWEEQMYVGRLGMEVLTELISFQRISTTIFTTAAYAIENPAQVKNLAATNEIASHTFYHSSFREEDLARSRQVLEEISGKKIQGLRMPRMAPVDMSLVHNAGYTYDSSINPTLVPGKYNNSHLPKSLYVEKGVFRVPCSVSPHLRIPLFWLSFKNFPYAIYKELAIQTLKKYGFLNLYFHPWEFTDLSRYRLPWYIKRHSGGLLIDKLQRLICDLTSEGTFVTMENFVNNVRKNNGLSIKSIG